MKIAVNTRLLLKDRLEGIGYFIHETLQRIVKNNPEIEFHFLFDRVYDSSFIYADNIVPVVLGPQARHPFLFYCWFEFSVYGYLKKHDIDLFLSQDGYMCLKSDVPQVAVIHDLNFVHNPDHIPYIVRKYYKRFFPKFANKAHRIATVSEYSKRDIVRNYGVSESVVDVVYNGVAEVYKPITEDEANRVKQGYAGNARYLCYVGSLHKRKI